MFRKCLGSAHRHLVRQTHRSLAFSRRPFATSVGAASEGSLADLRLELANYEVSHRVLSVTGALLECGVFDELPKAGGLRAEELAKRCNVKEDVLTRFLRFASCHGYAHQTMDSRWMHSPKSATLTDSEEARMDLTSSSKDFPKLFLKSDHKLRTGEDFFQAKFGKNMYEFMSENPARIKYWSHFMKGLNSDEILDEVCEIVDFSQFGKVVDVGGGLGNLVARISEKNPETECVLFELPAVIEEATAQWKSSADVEMVAGDFFKADDVAKLGGADCFVLKWVLGDWNDEQCVQILKNLHSIMKPEDTLLLQTHVVNDGVRNHPDKSFLHFFDMNTAVSHPGKIRTWDENDEILGKAQFSRKHRMMGSTGWFMISAKPQ